MADLVLGPIAEVARVEAVSHVGEKSLVAVQDLGQLQAVDPHIRGILGEDFLAHFDVLIDYGHKMLCMDEAKQMSQSIRGEHIPLVDPRDSEGDLPFAPRLIIPVQLSSSEGRRLFLRLDSGRNAPTVFEDTQEHLGG